jgi:hypothetical protein
MCKLYGPWACTHWTESPYEPDKSDPHCNGEGPYCHKFERVRQPKATLCMKCALKILEMQAVAKLEEEQKGEMKEIKENVLKVQAEDVKAKEGVKKAKTEGGKTPKTRKERKRAEESAAKKAAENSRK